MKNKYYAILDLFYKMKKKQQNIKFCSQPNHNKQEIEFMCLNENCHHFRLFCWQCLQDDQHTSHLKETKKISEFDIYSKQIKEEYNQFEIGLHNNLRSVQQNLSTFFEGLQQKYIISQEKFNQLNIQQLNQAIQHMIKFKKNILILESCFQNIINNFSDIISNQFQDLELNKLTYVDNQNSVKYFMRKKYNSDKEYPKILFLGTAGVGKTRLFKQLTENQILSLNNQTKEFQSLVIDEFQYTVVDSPSFEVDGDTESKDATLKQFAQYIQNNQQTLVSFVIVVNFDRVDLMRRKVMEVYRCFQKFQSMISIFVVDWQLSEQNSKDSSLIQERFQNFKVNNIQFIRNDVRNDQLKIILFEIIRPLQESICLADTVFNSYFYDKNQKQNAAR